MIILALDPSLTCCGAAAYEHPGPEKNIECFSYAAKGSNQPEKIEDFSHFIARTLDSYKPGFVCLEAAIRFIASYRKQSKFAGAADWSTPNADQLALVEIQGAIRQACIDRNIPWQTVDVKTWRSGLYGPGGGNLPRDEAKRRARQYCDLLKIKHSNGDQAEAACIAVWASTSALKLRWIRAGRAIQ